MFNICCFSGLVAQWDALNVTEQFSGLFSNTHLLLKYGFVTPWIHNSTCLTKIKLDYQAVDHFERDLGQNPHSTPSPLGKAIGKNIVFTLDACPGEGMRILAVGIW